MFGASECFGNRANQPILGRPRHTSRSPRLLVTRGPFRLASLHLHTTPRTRMACDTVTHRPRCLDSSPYPQQVRFYVECLHVSTYILVGARGCCWAWTMNQRVKVGQKEAKNCSRRSTGRYHPRQTASARSIGRYHPRQNWSSGEASGSIGRPIFGSSSLRD